MGSENRSAFADLLDLEEEIEEGARIVIDHELFVMEDGILRSEAVSSESQAQTSETFGFKWHQRETFESEAAIGGMRRWLIERYGSPKNWSWLDDYNDPILLDAGCGGSFSGLALLEPIFDRVRYLGVDISNAVNVARDRFADAGQRGEFMQCDLLKLPFPPGSIDLIFSEGVLHHTDSTESALKYLAGLLKPGGRFLFYVYKTKGPVREFTDDFIRGKLQALPPQEAWDAVMPLTKLGKLLGDLNLEIEIPEDISLLEIPAGRIDLQRLFYWHVCKAFYRPDLSMEEMNHINFDWFAPKNAHRQSPEEVHRWCAEAGLAIEHERIEEAGITIIARKTAVAE